MGIVERGDLADLRGDLMNKIFGLISANNKISMKKMANHFGETTRTIEYYVDRLKTQGRLVRRSGARGGYWEILKGTSKY